ncbi:hypothetical protein PRIPAC_82627 [Pristionchus pacificus]|uniref:Uncharacterized protein n=1 Tax=Pristionchus pacificus TaxID=54126 RepID=A0A2A6CP70_PRIPA|nr:hypothetical protein PRIPAC_82627 [Pristionchus pacificus]|eukprot:PDM79898.1 hypothetical protein PRIPAC_32477 [Pristionchus pacificus]
MADVDSTPSVDTTSSPFNLSAYKESALLLLAFLAPPAAIAVRQGKVDLESRHLALSLALYLSVICYLPAVAHAYWLLYVRDNGGVEEWAGARMRQAGGLWNEHGGVVKAKVDEYAPKLVERVDRVRNYTTEKVKYATEKKDQAMSFVTDKTSAAHEFYDDAKEAYAAGTAIDWAKEKMHIVVEKVKASLESYPRMQALVNYVEQRVPLVLEFLGKIYETIRSKLHAESVEEVTDGGMGESDRDDSTVTCGDILASIPRPLEVVNDDHEDTDSTVASPKSNRTEEMYETAEDDATMDDSFNEGRTEEEYSQEL